MVIVVEDPDAVNSVEPWDGDGGGGSNAVEDPEEDCWCWGVGGAGGGVGLLVNGEMDNRDINDEEVGVVVVVVVGGCGDGRSSGPLSRWKREYVDATWRAMSLSCPL